MVAVGDGWNAFCSPVEPSPEIRSSSAIPFGSMLAACHAAAAVFRYFHQIPCLATQDQSLWTFGVAEWQRVDSASATHVRLPPAYLVGLGAVGAAFILSLALTPGLCGSLVGIDPQMTDETGRNRLLSMFHEQVGQPKVALASILLEATSIDFYPNQTPHDVLRLPEPGSAVLSHRCRRAHYVVHLQQQWHARQYDRSQRS